MKIYIIILLFFALTAAGFFKAASLKRSVYETEGLKNTVLIINDRLSYFKKPVDILLLEACNVNGRYRVISTFKNRLERDGNIVSAWQSTDCEHILGEETCRVMDEFFQALGTSGLEGQNTLCVSTVNRLEACREKAAEEADNKAKLYKSLGFLAGAFAVIVFI